MQPENREKERERESREIRSKEIFRKDISNNQRNLTIRVYVREKPTGILNVMQPEKQRERGEKVRSKEIFRKVVSNSQGNLTTWAIPPNETKIIGDNVARKVVRTISLAARFSDLLRAEFYKSVLERNAILLNLKHEILFTKKNLYFHTYNKEIVKLRRS